MHELSIAQAIVDAAVEEADRRGGVRVTCVYLKLGQLSGVVKAALLTCYEVAAQLSPVAGSQLAIEEVAIVMMCPTCGARRPVVSPQQMSCRDCGTPASEIVAGRELEVVAMEIIE